MVGAAATLRELHLLALRPLATDDAYGQLIAEVNASMRESGVADHTMSLHDAVEGGMCLGGAGTLLLVDEAQDLTQAAAEVVRRSVASGASVLMLGDQSQNIMNFAGALPDAFDHVAAAARELQPGVAVRVRVMTPKDICHALRSDKELNKCTSGLRVLVGDKIQRGETTAAITTKHDVERKQATAAKRAANPASPSVKKKK